MSIYTLAALLDKFGHENHAVCSFNVYNMEFTQGVMQAAQEENVPVVLMISELALEFTPLEMIATICQTAARNSTVPVCILLDHGNSSAVIQECLRMGISVMFDGSNLPLEENIQLTAYYADLAHRHHVSIEAELGSISGGESQIESNTRPFTDPAEAERFMRETGIDALAISIGNRHGFYKGKTELDFSRLKAIREKVDIPLVLHGGSDLPESQINLAIEYGIRKINFGTDVKFAFAQAMKQVLSQDPMPFQPIQILSPCRNAVVEEVRKKIRISRGEGRAGRVAAGAV
ncbi:MAG: class II fructose-bisphosphate aldolase family protein [Spirochaetaceae bacterium]|nr:MAG: class II fructose-bisphosphate aldolase family protein [Spirochaetaceae bacterium]